MSLLNFPMASPETWAEMDRHIFMSFFKSVVFFNIVQIISSDNYCPLHLHLGNNTCQDTPSDTHVTSKRAFSVNIVSFLCLKNEELWNSVLQIRRGNRENKGIISHISP